MQSITKMIATFIISCILPGCAHEFSCDAVTKALSKKHASIVITDIGPTGRIVNFSGIDINTGRKFYYEAEGGMYLPVKEIAQIGDTLIKREGQTDFLLRKKDFIVKFRFVCAENQYYGFTIDTLKRGITL
jgi:hypothetical protein